jgi:adenylate cyclase
MKSRRPQVDRVLTRPAVAVLRFADLDGNPTHTYFSDGLHEDIITALAGWRRFPIIASSSTHCSRDDKRDTQDIALSLDARYIVDGSVRHSGSRIRITARLIESDDSRCLWAESFDLPFQDILAVQDEAAQKIVGIVGPELEFAELSRIRTKPPTDLTAWDYCLRGASLLKRSNRKANADARSDFKQAVALDPEYSDAFTGLAYSYLRDLLLVGPNDRSTIIDKGLEAARQAVALDCNSSMAHLALATAQVWLEQLDLMIAESELAIELNPSNAAARMALGNRLDLIGRTLEGIKEMELSLRLNPRDPRRFTFMGFLSRAHVDLADYEKALQWARQSVQLRPDLPEPHFRLAVCLGHLDRVEEAQNALTECERVKPSFVESYQGWRPYADSLRNEHFFDGLRRHGLFK